MSIVRLVGLSVILERLFDGGEFSIISTLNFLFRRIINTPSQPHNAARVDDLISTKVIRDARLRFTPRFEVPGWVFKFSV